MTEMQELRKRRLTNSIPAVAVARLANIGRERVSLLERGHIAPREDEVKRLTAALDQLVAIRQAAIEAGWPAGAI